MRVTPILSQLIKVLIKGVVGLFAAAFCLLMIDATARGQSAGDYRSATTGNWNTTATWETFNGATWVPAVATPTSADGMITIRSGHTVTISASGLSYDQVTVDSGGQVTVAATITHTLANGAGTDLTINGTWLNQGGTWTVTGATWTVGAGGTYIHNTTSGIATPLGVSTLDPASNFIYRGSSTLTPAVSTSGRTYGNLSFESTSGAWTASLSGGGTLTINGDFTIGTGATYSTTQTGVMTFAGSFTNNGTLTNSTNTQVYTFTGSSKVISGASAIQFESWNVSLGASITLMRDVSIASTFTGTISGTLDCGTNIVSGAGSFTVSSGATLGIGSTDGITSSGATGNIQVTGTRTFDPGANYNYNGSGQVTGNGLPSTVSTLTIGAGGVTLSQSVTVSTTLVLTGDITTGAFTLFMGNGSTSSGNGDVVGDVNRSDLNGGTPRSFGNPNVQITETAGTVSDMTVSLVKGSTPSDFLNSVKRVYTLTPNGGSSFAASVQLHYLDTELNGNDESMLRLWRKDITLGWQDKGKDLVGGSDTTNNWVKLSGVTQFSPWTISGPAAPSYAKLQSFKATSYDAGVLIDWETGLEVDNLGYNLYREKGGKRTRINPSMIAGSALLAGPGVGLKSGRAYEWSDELRTELDVSYWLEEVDLNGRSTWHGPASVERAIPGRLPPSARGRAVLLSDVGADNTKNVLTPSPLRTAKPARLAAMSVESQSNFAGRTAVKIAVNREGWYRVSAEELFSAGLDASTDPRMLQLFVEGQEQSFIVKGQDDGHLDPTDSVEFYGLGLDSTVTDTRVYWLVAGSQPGRRVEEVRGKGSRAASTSFTHTVERRDRSIYFSALRNGEKENFFGAVVARQPVDQLLTVRHLDKGSAADATIEVALQGVTLLQHRVKVELNGAHLGEVSFASQAEGLATFSLSQARLKEGQNLVTLTSMGSESDVSLVNYIRIAYAHTYVADDNALRFNILNKRQVTIDGFTSGSLRVLDITDPDVVREVSARTQGGDDNYSVTVSAPKGGNRLLWAFADETAKQPVTIAANRTSNLRDSGHAADFVIIAHRDFIDSVKPIQELRETQGMAVTVVDVEDIFDEFSFGEKSPQAIKEFLALARTSWKKSPRFALLVGDASLDPSNHLGRGYFDFVPTKLIDTTFMETASDDWFADSDGDGLAEIALGRLPVRTAEEASRMIFKIVNYDGATKAREILLASDLNDGIDFQSERDQIRSLAPDDVTIQIIDRGQLGATARSQMLDSLNRGPWIVSYFGHGSVELWRGNLFTSTDALALTNSGNLPVFFAITCLNGFFQDPSLESIAESLMKAERGGAVAVWASSGMCEAYPQAMLDQEMFRLILASDGSLMLGEAALRAKAAVGDSDVRRTYILFGDPTTRLR